MARVHRGPGRSPFWARVGRKGRDIALAPGTPVALPPASSVPATPDLEAPAVPPPAPVTRAGATVATPAPPAEPTRPSNGTYVIRLTTQHTSGSPALDVLALLAARMNELRGRRIAVGELPTEVTVRCLGPGSLLVGSASGTASLVGAVRVMPLDETTVPLAGGCRVSSTLGRTGLEVAATIGAT